MLSLSLSLSFLFLFFIDGIALHHFTGELCLFFGGREGEREGGGKREDEGEEGKGGEGEAIIQRCSKAFFSLIRYLLLRYM